MREGIKSAIKYAWHGSGRRWEAAWIGLIGGVVGGSFVWWFGVKMPDALEHISNPFWHAAFEFAICVASGVAIVFALRLAWWPVHQRLQPYGGLMSLLAPMLPVILMASGIFAFAVLFGSGATLLAIQMQSWPKKPGNDAVEESAPQAPLSVVEQQYRLDLRKFIMSCLKDSNEGFLSTMGSLMNAYSKKIGEEESRPVREIMLYALQSGVQDQYNTLKIMVNRPIEAIDRNAVENTLIAYLLNYVYSQRTYFIQLQKMSRAEPLPENLNAWQHADQECARLYRDLRTSPVADKLLREAVPEPFAASNRSK